jgi:predicted DNA-binding transcriptional regulator
MPEKKIRRCSLCRIPGHTKRTCKETEETMKTSSVFVRVEKEVEKSPHIINLKKDKKEKDIWEMVPVYGEYKPKEKVITKTIDLATHVKEANKKSEFINDIKNINLSLKENKKINHAKVNKIKQEKDEYIVIGTSFLEDRKKKIKPKREFAFKFGFFESLRNLLCGFKFQRLAFQMVVLLLVGSMVYPAFGYYTKIKAVEEIVIGQGTNGFLALQESTVAAFQSDIGKAQEQLTNALQSFSTANSIIEEDFQMLLSVAKFLPVIGTQVNSRQSLLVAGSHLALGNTYLVKGISEAQKDIDLPLTDRFQILQNHLNGAIPQYNEALSSLNKVDLKTVPVEYQQTFSEFKVLFGAFIDDMEDLVDLSGAVNTIFGDDSFKRYLIIFQNHHEIRPTGGFMGSFAVLDIQKRKILNLAIPGGGTYDLKGQLTEFVNPPLPLQLLNTRWEFQDANWFPNFPSSAEKIEWFYENGRGSTVDGVIAINASVLERVLKVMGPVETEGMLLADSDAIGQLQYEVEIGYDKETEQPKEILSEVLSNLMNSLTSLETTDVVGLLTELHSALEQKELQVYINDQLVQNELSSFGWTGEILPVNSSQDYLSVIHTNIQGQKSDAKIEQKINHEVVVEENGDIYDTVVIERTHSGSPGERFYGGANISYVRVYVPDGSELLEGGGFTFPPEEAFRSPEEWCENDEMLGLLEKDESIHLGTGTRITREFGKTVFGNWVITFPGETSKIFFKYKLPFKIPVNKLPEDNMSKWQSVFLPSLDRETSHYSLLVQKQSGVTSDFSSTVIYPLGWLPMWRSNDDIDLALNGARYFTTLETDEVIGVALQKELDNNK